MYHIWNGVTDVSREQLVADLRAVNETTAGPPTVSTVHEECEGTVRDYVSTFGTWYGALDAADLAADLSPPQVDRETLIENLRHVASEIARSPTVEQITEQGEYDIETYELVFGSYLLALEAADIDPETTQYNFSEVEPPKDRDTTKNVRYLRENGPTPSSEMPLGSSVSDREHGMWRFVMNSGQGSTDTAGATEAVYYLDEQHDPESVLRTFFKTNDALVQNKSRHGITLGVRNHNPNWVDTAKDLLDELEESSPSESATEVSVLVVSPTDEILSQAVSQTVETVVDDIDVIKNADAESGYVIGMPEERQALWNRVDIGDIVMVRTETEINTFTVEQTVVDWNAASELWAQYEDGVRVAGPDRPWPYLLVGTTGSEVDLDMTAFWDTVSVDDASDQFQYVPTEALAELRSSYGSLSQFVAAQSDGGTDDGSEDAKANETDTQTHSNDFTGDGGSGGSEDSIVEIDSTIAFLATEHHNEDVASFVGAHLKEAVDDIEPNVSTVTSASTATVPVDLTSTQRALISALCGDGGEYESLDAFVEDALRTHMQISDEKREISIRLEGPTAAALERFAETKDSEIQEVLSEQIAELVSRKVQ